MTRLRSLALPVLAGLAFVLLTMEPPSTASAAPPIDPAIAGAPVAPAVAPVADPVDVVAQALDAIQHGNGWLAAALALSLAVMAVRAFGAGFLPVLGSDRAGVVLTLAGAFFGAVAHALAAGQPIGAPVAFAAIKVALGAIGGYVGLKRLLAPKDAAAVVAK